VARAEYRGGAWHDGVTITRQGRCKPRDVLRQHSFAGKAPFARTRSVIVAQTSLDAADGLANDSELPQRRGSSHSMPTLASAMRAGAATPRAT
jgi:hypothetical protein